MLKYDKSVLFNMNKKLHNIIYINIVSGTQGQYLLFLNYDFFYRICQLLFSANLDINLYYGFSLLHKLSLVQNSVV